MKKYALLNIDFKPIPTIISISNIQVNGFGWGTGRVYIHYKGTQDLYYAGELVYFHQEHVVFQSDNMKEIKERAMLEIL